MNALPSRKPKAFPSPEPALSCLSPCLPEGLRPEVATRGIVNKDRIKNAIRAIDSKILMTSYHPSVCENSQRAVQEALETMRAECAEAKWMAYQVDYLELQIRLSGYLNSPGKDPGPINRSAILATTQDIHRLLPAIRSVPDEAPLLEKQPDLPPRPVKTQRRSALGAIKDAYQRASRVGFWRLDPDLGCATA